MTGPMLTTLREDIERFHIETGQKPSEWFMDVEGLPAWGSSPGMEAAPDVVQVP